METISLARGVPAPECIPVEELADCARAAIHADGATVLSYGSPGGYGPLREWIAERHGVGPGRVVVTNGSLQGFVFLSQLLARPGERVLVEAPTYDRPLKILDELGAEIAAVPQTGDGIDVEALEEELENGRRPAFLYVIPTFQNPSGRTLGADARRRLVELAAERDLLVLEDDPYGLVRFEGAPPPTLHELDGGDRVIYSSSFSKTVAPGVRVGYLVVPERLAGPLEAVATSTYITPALLSQATVHEFLRRGAFERNLGLVRSLLKARRDALLGALDEHLAGTGAAWSRPQGGYFLWLDLPPGTDAVELLAAAEAVGVTFVPGPDFFPRGSGGRSAARLAFSFAAPSQLADAVGRLAPLLAAAPVDLRQQHAA
ncbi:MAG: PLP-dependent aminotransferase family protein [Actinomycetota bacterium]|nr:PLP-dependent aminotransferase family protein [Actinomycetota bacterium]